MNTFTADVKLQWFRENDICAKVQREIVLSHYTLCNPIDLAK